MKVILLGALFAAALFVGILLLLALGRRVGARYLEREGEVSQKGLGALEGAIFALLGLVLAFSFSGALDRFDARRHLVVEEANAVGTAWLRTDLLPETARDPMRDLFRSYLDSRIETYRKVPFALVLSVTVYVIVDLEYPRVGLIRVTDSDEVLSDLRVSMD